MTTEPTITTILQDIADAYEDGSAQEQSCSYILRCVLIAMDRGTLDQLEAHVGTLADTWLAVRDGDE